MLFKDNGNGRTEAGESIDPIAAGIEEISLNHRNLDQRRTGGYCLAQTALFKRDDGAHGQVAGAIVAFTA